VRSPDQRLAYHKSVRKANAALAKPKRMPHSDQYICAPMTDAVILREGGISTSPPKISDRPGDIATRAFCAPITDAVILREGGVSTSTPKLSDRPRAGVVRLRRNAPARGGGRSRVAAMRLQEASANKQVCIAQQRHACAPNKEKPARKRVF